MARAVLTSVRATFGAVCPVGAHYIGTGACHFSTGTRHFDIGASCTNDVFINSFRFNCTLCTASFKDRKGLTRHFKVSPGHYEYLEGHPELRRPRVLGEEPLTNDKQTGRFEMGNCAASKKNSFLLDKRDK